jgi:hypothetical protein
VKLAAIAVIAIASSLMLVSTSGAATASCGVPISSSVTLTSDLNCSGDGLVIQPGADQRAPIDVNLNGHTVRGSGSGSGVFITAGGATVRNGVISGFATGVYINGWLDIRLSRLVVSRNGVGVIDATGGSVVISNSSISENADFGISGIGPQGFIVLTIKETRVAKNGGDGVRFAFTDGYTILRSALVDNAGYGLSSDDSSGTISDSTASGNGASGVYINDDYGGTVFNRVTNVLAERNGQWGIALTVGPLFPLYDGGGNRANHNGQPAQCLNIVCS